MSAQPEYIDASPVVMGFDFNALASVPSSDSVPSVPHDAAMRTGNDPIPQGLGGLEWRQTPAQPPQGHADTIPGYPWQGHPEIALSTPFTGPEGTSPLERGGPNVGAYAAAPPQPTAYQGAAYPYAAPGTYEPAQGQVPFGGYAGPDLGASRDERRARRQDRRDTRSLNRGDRRYGPMDVPGANGRYVYRLYYGTNGQDGVIEIRVSGDPGKLPAGSRLSPGDEGYSAIVAQVGTWQQNKARHRTQIAQAAAQGITAITQAAGGGRRRRGGKRGGKRRGGGAGPGYAPPEESSLPGWVVPVAVGSVAAVLLAVVVSKSKD